MDFFESFRVFLDTSVESDPDFQRMSGRQERHFPAFSGGGHPFEDRDSMDTMRERMDRDREAFFADREPQGRPFSSPFFRVRGTENCTYGKISSCHSFIFEDADNTLCLLRCVHAWAAFIAHFAKNCQN